MDCGQRRGGLSPLHRPEMPPEHGQSGTGFTVAVSAPAIDAIVVPRCGRAHAEHGPFEPNENFGTVVGAGLRHAQDQLAITRAGAVAARDRAALAVEESCGPRELYRIRSASHGPNMHRRLTSVQWDFRLFPRATPRS